MVSVGSKADIRQYAFPVPMLQDNRRLEIWIRRRIGDCCIITALIHYSDAAVTYTALCPSSKQGCYKSGICQVKSKSGRSQVSVESDSRTKLLESSPSPAKLDSSPDELVAALASHVIDDGAALLYILLPIIKWLNNQLCMLTLFDPRPDEALEAFDKKFN